MILDTIRVRISLLIALLPVAFVAGCDDSLPTESQLSKRDVLYSSPSSIIDDIYTLASADQRIGYVGFGVLYSAPRNGMMAYGIGSVRDRLYAIEVGSIDGLKQTKIPRGDSNLVVEEYSIVLSPNAKLVAYALYDSTNARSSLWVGSSTGRESRKIADGMARQTTPAFSSDGMSIAWIGEPAPGERHGKLYVASTIGTSTPRPVADSARIYADGLSTIEWSPSASGHDWIAYAALNTAGSTDIRVALADGSQSWNVTSDDVEDMMPSWSPGGSQLVFVTEPGDIWMVNADGENLRRVSIPSAPCAFPQWSPDGRRILFTGYGIRISPRLGSLQVVDTSGMNSRMIAINAYRGFWID